MRALLRKVGLLFLATTFCLGLSPFLLTARAADAAELKESAGVVADDSKGKVSTDVVGVSADVVETKAARGTATLVIVYGLDSTGKPTLLVNKSYDFYPGAVIKDLFDAAVRAGDIKDFAVDAGGFLTSVTGKAGTKIAATRYDSTSLYWSQFEDGNYSNFSKGTVLTQKIEAGHSYQFAWDSYPTAAAPDWGKLPAASDKTSTVAGGGAAAGTATLSIVRGLDFNSSPNLLVNVRFGFSTNATINDLLQAAKTQGDLKDFAVDAGGYLSSVTDKDGKMVAKSSDWVLYWSSYEDGVYSDFSKGTVLTQKLEAGHSYQFAWDSYPTAKAPDWTTVAKATDGEGIAGRPDGGGTPTTDPTSPSTRPTAVDFSVHSTLLNNIRDSYLGTSDPLESLVLAAVAPRDRIDTEALTRAALQVFETDDSLRAPVDLPKYVLGLTACRIDANAVPTSQGTVDLVEAMGSSTKSNTGINSMCFTLLAYESGFYEVPEAALKTKTELIGDILQLQLADGGFALSGTVSDADMTAIVITALSSYVEADEDVAAAVSRALVALKSLQLGDGGFPYLGAQESNANSTAMAVVALCSMGIDPVQDSLARPKSGVTTLATPESWVTESGATPLSALLGFANDGLSAYAYLKGGPDNEMATQQGFTAQVAYEGYARVGSAYNVYTRAKDAEVLWEEGTGEGDTQEDPEGGKALLPQAGDSGFLSAMILVAFATGASTVLLRGRAGRARRVERLGKGHRG